MREYAPTARPYELMTIFSPEVADDSVTEQLEVITGYIRTAGGAVYQVLQDAPWGRRRFAYPIRHSGRDVRDGFYSVIHFDLVPSQVFEVERDLKLDERVLRFLLTLNDVKETPAETTETSDGEAVAPAPVVRSEIAAGDLVRNAEAARAAADAAREAQEAARAAAEAARPQQQNTNRDDRPRQPAQPAPEVPAAVAVALIVEPAVSAPTEGAAAETAPAAEFAPVLAETGSVVAEAAPAIAETESAAETTPVITETEPVVESSPDVAEAVTSDAPVAETDATATAEAAAVVPTEPETAPADDAEPSRA